jgi:hypothetical protein
MYRITQEILPNKIQCLKLRSPQIAVKSIEDAINLGGTIHNVQADSLQHLLTLEIYLSQKIWDQTKHLFTYKVA